MINIFLFLSICFLFVYLVGKILEKIRVPWVFAALLLGAILAAYNPFKEITDSSSFSFLAQMGMYFLLFMVGLELDLDEIKKNKNFIFHSAAFIIFMEGIAGCLLIHYVFSCSWLISFLVGLSFATVGEAILIPILDEFKIINTKLGQAIIGIGTVDDVIEMIILIFVTIFIGVHSEGEIIKIIIALTLLFVLTFIFKEFRRKGEQFSLHQIETIFFLVVAVMLLFVGIGYYADAAPLAALLAGLSLKTFLKEERLKLIDREIKITAYGFFVPTFFLWVGSTIDIKTIAAAPFLVLLIVLVSKSVKLISSYIVAHKELGKKQSILLGIGLSVRFSTSIVIITILYESGLIDLNLYSVIIASSIIFKFIVPVLFSNLIVKWGVSRKVLPSPIFK